ncbi:enoyl-CoA hydratase [Paracoccus sp. S-4012]|uniref:enoyl-CoA hydratase/isomerase family protein n=1 Tax=Paracoccus sp. S-4012 TaxID=2665648 RepID=UPI0012B0C318|nr:enoyl-CoA hydratase/isomerase family protein [Paracoccus sp. S-4012]MRX48881.1 enoyl-CoA hydratase [Paracoccus sp. S-4012]
MTIDCSTRDGIARVVLSRPEKRNAITPAMHEALTELWPRLEADPRVRVIVLTGKGSAFCAGADVHEFLPHIARLIAEGKDPGHFCGLTRRVPGKPMIAAVNGPAYGGGMELMLASDIRIASDKARFALPEVQLGAIAGAGGITRLFRELPTAIANEMVITGNPIDAARAFQLGLVSAVHPPDELAPAAEALARRITSNAPLAVMASRDLGAIAGDDPLEEALEREREGFRQIVETEDFRIGTKGFGGAAPPIYVGR